MVDPSVWGPPMWRTLHFIALGYPANPTPQVTAQYKAFFEAFGAVIPCQVCAVNYARHLREVPIDAFIHDSEKQHPLFEWSVHLHNTVNAENNKPFVSVQQALAMYATGGGGGGGGGRGGREEQGASPCTKSFADADLVTTIAFGVMCAVVAAGVVYLWMRRKGGGGGGGGRR